jgi:hypothetical protein
VSDRVYARSPYNRDAAPRVPNAADGVYVEQGGSRSMLKLTGTPAKALGATIALGVDPVQ